MSFRGSLFMIGGAKGTKMKKRNHYKMINIDSIVRIISIQ